MSAVMRKKRFWLVLLVFLLAVPLALLLSRVVGGFVRDVIAVPILYLVWIGRLYFRAVPEVLFWGALLLLGVVLIISSVLIAPSDPAGDERPSGKAEANQPYPGTVERLTAQIQFAKRSTYFRRRLAQRLGTLMVKSLGYGERYRLEHVEQGLDVLDAPMEIRAFISEGGQLILPSGPVGLLAWLKWRLSGRRTLDAHPVDLESVVRFLEERLEVS